MMNKVEIQKRIEELEARRFYLSMKDRWSQDDYEADRKMWTEALELKKALVDM